MQAESFPARFAGPGGLARGYALAVGSFVPKAHAQPHSALTVINAVMGLSSAAFDLPGIAIFTFYPPTTASRKTSRNCRRAIQTAPSSAVAVDA
jgi:Na+/melibiose symporter-like transporter